MHRPQVSRHLKALGLRRGQLPPEQLDQLRRLFEEHRGRRACYRLVAEGMNNGCANLPAGLMDPTAVLTNSATGAVYSVPLGLAFYSAWLGTVADGCLRKVLLSLQLEMLWSPCA